MLQDNVTIDALKQEKLGEVNLDNVVERNTKKEQIQLFDDMFVVINNPKDQIEP